MWEADFGTVDGAVAGCFQDGEVVGIFGVEYYTLERSLFVYTISMNALALGVEKIVYLQTFNS